MIPPLCATLGPVLAGPEGCSRGRWRSGPSKWRHTAAPAGRGQGAPRTCRCIETAIQARRFRSDDRRQGAPRTCRCIETEARSSLETSCSRQGAPRTCRCIETSRPGCPSRRWPSVREHHAPGALRLYVKRTLPVAPDVREHHAPVGALRPSSAAISMSRWTSQGAPRTCRCIETPC